MSGTGFLFAQDLLDELGGWEYFLLTEDLEFTADLVARGIRIAYCHDAMVYDEQPQSFKQSIIQRSRWVKGYLQVVAKRGGSMVKTMLCDGSFACFDMLMCTIPAVVLTVVSLVLNAAMFVVGITSARSQMDIFFASVLVSVVNSYATMYLLGAVTLLTEGRRIRCSRGKKIAYSFTFPIFVFSFGIAMLVAVFGNIEWKPSSTAWPSPLAIWAAFLPRSCASCGKTESCDKLPVAEMFHIFPGNCAKAQERENLELELY